MPSSSSASVTSAASPPLSRTVSSLAGIGATSMFAFVHLFARVFSRFADGRYLANLTFVEQTKELQLELFDGTNGDRFIGRFDEASAESMRNACRSGLSWSSFFELVSKAFAEGTLDFNAPSLSLKITLKHERQSDSIPHPAFTSSILLTLEIPPPAQNNDAENALRDLCDQLLSHAALRGSDSAGEVQRMENVGRASDAASWNAEQLQTEVAVMEGEVQRAQEQIERCTTFVQGLSSQGVDVAAVSSLVQSDMSVVDRATCRVEDPLGALGIEHKVYDAIFLRLLKSEFCILYRLGEGHHLCDTLPPYAAEQVNTPEGIQRILGTSPRKAAWDILAGAVQTWHFCPLALQTHCEALIPAPCKPEHKAGALFYMAYYLLYCTTSISQLNVREGSLIRYLSAIEASYRPKAAPFHNALHATDVLQAVGYFIASLDPRRCVLPPSDVLSLILAATMVCANHNGLDSNYHARTNSNLSATFSGQSITQSMHTTYGFELMKLPKYNILEFTDVAMRNQLRCAVGDVIRMTDTSHGDSILTALRLRLQRSDTVLCDDDGRELARYIILRSAKEAYCARGTETFRSFAAAIRAERIALGAAEKKAGLSPLSPFTGSCLQSSVEFAKLMLFRLNFHALPFFAALAELAPRSSSLLAAGVVANRSLYQNAEERSSLGETVG